MYLHTPALEVGSWWRVDTASSTNTPTTVYAHDGTDAIPTSLGASGSTVRNSRADGTAVFWSATQTLYCKELTYQGVPTGTVVTSTGAIPAAPGATAPVDIATISAAVAALPTTYLTQASATSTYIHWDGTNLTQSGVAVALTATLTAPAASGDTTGVTDTAAIQALINQAATAGGGRVMLRPAPVTAPYYITTLSLKTGVELVGTSVQGTVLKAKPSTHDTNPMIQLASTGEYSWAIRNLTIDGNNGSIRAGNRGLQTNSFDGINITSYVPNTGQLFGPYYSDMTSFLEDVYVVNCSRDNFSATGRASEVKYRGCTSLAASRYGYYIGAADSFYESCTAGENGRQGYYIDSSVNMFVNCKAFFSGRVTAASGDGFYVAPTYQGNLIEGCFAQDNFKNGFHLDGCTKTRAYGTASGNVSSHIRLNNATQCDVNITLNASNGAAANATYALDFSGTNDKNKVVITGEANETNPHFLTSSTSPSGNDIQFGGAFMTKTYAYASTIAVDPFWTNHAFITLTGDATITVGTNANWKGYLGKRLAMSITQDGTGGHAATFNSDFQVNWTPDTSASKTNTINFIHNGTKWIQIGATTGV